MSPRLIPLPGDGGRAENIACKKICISAMPLRYHYPVALICSEQGECHGTFAVICSDPAECGAGTVEGGLRGVLTIAKLHGDSVAYYESTVDQNSVENSAALGPDGYYSEDEMKPAQAWVVARERVKSERVCAQLGVEVGAEVRGDAVRTWFNKALAPSRLKLGRAPKESGVLGFDLTFCAG